MIKTSQNVIDATNLFMNAADPSQTWTEHNVLCMDQQHQAAYHCALCAFDLYRKEWGAFDICRWKWPVAELTTTGKRFVGNEPWTVLFREALRAIRSARRLQRTKGS